MKIHVIERVLDAEIGDYFRGIGSSTPRQWRADTRPTNRHAPGWSSVTREGLEALSKDGQQLFEDSTGVELPWNLSWHGPAVDLPVQQQVSLPLDPKDWGDYLKGVSATDLVAAYARFGGFLRQAADFRALARLFERATSPRGMASPATAIDLWALAARWGYSPGRLHRRLWAVRRRADEILAPHGVKVSWRALGIALERGPRATGKAAVFAAAETLRGPWADGWLRSYRDARASLVAASRSQGDLARAEAARAKSVKTVVEGRFGVAHGDRLTAAVQQALAA